MAQSGVLLNTVIATSTRNCMCGAVVFDERLTLGHLKNETYSFLLKSFSYVAARLIYFIESIDPMIEQYCEWDSCAVLLCWCRKQHGNECSIAAPRARVSATARVGIKLASQVPVIHKLPVSTLLIGLPPGARTFLNSISEIFLGSQYDCIKYFSQEKDTTISG